MIPPTHKEFHSCFHLTAVTLSIGRTVLRIISSFSACISDIFSLGSSFFKVVFYLALSLMLLLAFRFFFFFYLFIGLVHHGVNISCCLLLTSFFSFLFFIPFDLRSCSTFSFYFFFFFVILLKYRQRLAGIFADIERLSLLRFLLSFLLSYTRFPEFV